MALLECNCFSEMLGMSVSFYAIIPQQTQKQIGMEGKAGTGNHPTLYLLHGASDDHTIWLRRTSIERYVAELGLAVIMPNVHLSRYTDMDRGGRYFSWVAEELPTIARSFFHLSDKREDNFVAGLSMGGYGAFKVALNKPENYAAAASLSGSLDLLGGIDSWNEERCRKAEAIFGDLKQLEGSRHDLFHLLATTDKGSLPQLYQCCGTEDFLYDGNQKFIAHARELGVPVTYDEGPGVHNWAYWDQQIQKVLEWLPLPSQDA